MTLSIPKFVRLLDASVGIHDDVNVYPAVKTLYADTVHVPSTRFVAGVLGEGSR